MQSFKKEPEKDTVPSYGLLPINHAYNEGKITFKEWLAQSREWALAMIEQHGEIPVKRDLRKTRPLSPQ
ncbi:MAG TPA: hypothetical protein VIX20_02300 [Ktedonobacteraceae bacterium]